MVAISVLDRVTEVSDLLRDALKRTPITDETRRKMSEAHVGRRHSEEVRRKMSEAHKGKRLSEETRRKLSEYHNGARERRQ